MRAGEILEVDFGLPVGSEAGFVRPAVVVTSTVILARQPRTFQVVPLTRSVERALPYELRLESWEPLSSAQCHLLTTVDMFAWTGMSLGEVDSMDLLRIRELLSDMLDLDR